MTPSNFPHHAMCRPRGQRSRHDVEPARQTNASDRHAAGTNGQTTGRSQAVECGGEAPSFEALFKASFGALNKASKLIQAVLQKWRRSPPEGPCGSIRGAIGSQRDARTRLQSRFEFLTEDVARMSTSWTCIFQRKITSGGEGTHVESHLAPKPMDGQLKPISGGAKPSKGEAVGRRAGLGWAPGAGGPRPAANGTPRQRARPGPGGRPETARSGNPRKTAGSKNRQKSGLEAFPGPKEVEI